MKKLLFSFLLVAGFFSVQAQELGVKGGIQLSNLKESFDGQSETYDMAFDFHVGVYGEFSLSDLISIQPEIVYSREGAKVSEEDETVRLQTDYIQVPVIVKFHVGERFNLQAGPQIGFQVAAKAKSDGNSINLKDFIDFKNPVIAGAAGLGYEVSEAIEVGGRYNFGLSNLLDDEEVTWKANVIQFYLTYKLR
ncbi:porin family protein [Fulvivirga sedimenti]|uniref:PorT family protein n=1 Tax=Fulvivirga sedimenti TaxID=2879465 RepID=A0A9X1HWU4_9BACT|nr:porin family protein [Fulvivirga sedimenti]MCA6078850.1 PorT family protein [Fulvivirga sedimenti]